MKAQHKRQDTQIRVTPVSENLDRSRVRWVELIKWFGVEIEQQESLLYGVALFFECLSLLHDGEAALIETYRKQFRNVIQTGKETGQRARAVLQEVKTDPSKVTLIEQFNFAPCAGFSDAAGLAKRAGILLQMYEKLFPNRPRDRPFTKAETLRLMEAAAAALR